MSLTDPDILRQSKFTDDEIDKFKKSRFGKTVPTRYFKRTCIYGSVRKTTFQLINDLSK